MFSFFSLFFFLTIFFWNEYTDISAPECVTEPFYFQFVHYFGPTFISLDKFTFSLSLSPIFKGQVSSFISHDIAYTYTVCEKLENKTKNDIEQNKLTLLGQ